MFFFLFCKSSHNFFPGQVVCESQRRPLMSKYFYSFRGSLNSSRPSHYGNPPRQYEREREICARVAHKSMHCCYCSMMMMTRTSTKRRSRGSAGVA